MSITNPFGCWTFHIKNSSKHTNYSDIVDVSVSIRDRNVDNVRIIGCFDEFLIDWSMSAQVWMRWIQCREVICWLQENVDLQLEAVYRQRLAEVGQAVKKRLVFSLYSVNNIKCVVHAVYPMSRKCRLTWTNLRNFPWEPGTVSSELFVIWRLRM